MVLLLMALGNVLAPERPAEASGDAHPGASAAAPSPAQPEAQDTLTILFTADTRGNLVPCSCPSHPVGGLARRAGFLRRRGDRAAAGGTVLRLDVGGFLPEGEVPLRASPTTAARLTRLLLEAMEVEGVEATVLDHRERELLRRLAPRPYEELGDRLLDADPPGPARVVRWGHARIALLALEESLADSTIERAAQAARRGGDYLIVLARADAESGRRLARLSRADLVLLSRGARPESILYEGSIPMYGCGLDGRDVGEIRLLPAGAEGSAPGTAGGGGRFRLLAHRLQPMDEGVSEDLPLGRKVRGLLLEEGSNASALLGDRE